MKLSIVIPVYNVERYIEKCLKSCINQDIQEYDYEIIVVNDGTPDNSMEIVRRIADNHSNIHIIDQQNQGLSAARNNGFAIAKGEYVWFIDSDDWIEENCLGRITTILNTEVDLLQLKYRLTYDDESLNKDINITTYKGIISGKEVSLMGGLPIPAQFTIYRADFLRSNKLAFFNGIYHEDMEFKPRVLYYAEKVSFDDTISYNYYQRTTGSITSVFTIKRANDIIIVANSLYNFSRELPRRYKRCFNDLISLNINNILYGMNMLDTSGKHEVLEKLNSNKHLFKSMICSRKCKYIIEGLILRLSVKFGVVLHHIIR